MAFNPKTWPLHKYAGSIGSLMDKALEDGLVLVEVPSKAEAKRITMTMGLYAKAYKAQLEDNPDLAYDATKYAYITSKQVMGKGEYEGRVYVCVLNENKPEFNIVSNPAHVFSESGFKP